MARRSPRDAEPPGAHCPGRFGGGRSLLHFVEPFPAGKGCRFCGGCGGQCPPPYRASLPLEPLINPERMEESKEYTEPFLSAWARNAASTMVSSILLKETPSGSHR